MHDWWIWPHCHALLRPPPNFRQFWTCSSRCHDCHSTVPACRSMWIELIRRHIRWPFHLEKTRQWDSERLFENETGQRKSKNSYQLRCLGCKTSLDHECVTGTRQPSLCTFPSTYDISLPSVGYCQCLSYTNFIRFKFREQKKNRKKLIFPFTLEPVPCRHFAERQFEWVACDVWTPTS